MKPYVLVVGASDIKEYAFILLLEGRNTRDFIIQVTDKYLNKANELVMLFGNYGIEEDDERVRRNILSRNGFNLTVTEIRIRRIGAVLT